MQERGHWEVYFDEAMVAQVTVKLIFDTLSALKYMKDKVMNRVYSDFISD